MVTEVPGNPGQSVVNASDTIITEVEARFGIHPGRLACFVILPRGSSGIQEMQAWKFRARPERWDPITKAEIESALRQALPALPRHDELLARVIEAGGTLDDEVTEPVFEPLAIGDLPAPHLPFKCAHFERFKTLARNTRAALGRDSRAAPVGDLFLASLTPDDWGRCPFHSADWRSIADESVRILAASSIQTRDELASAARSSGLPRIDRAWLLSLFNMPLIITDHSFADGQHRGCALRFSGASHVSAVTDFVTTRGAPTIWTYAGEG